MKIRTCIEAITVGVKGQWQLSSPGIALPNRMILLEANFRLAGHDQESGDMCGLTPLQSP